MLLGRSPLRISFVGGGTDLEEYHKKYDGYSISATINKFVFVAAKLRTDNLFQFNNLSVLVTSADIFMPSFVCDRPVELGANDYCVIFKIQEGSQYLN